MYSVNPKTGKPIQILKTETVLTRTKRTLVWHSPTFQGDHSKWQRVAVIVTDHESLKTIHNPQIVYISPTINDKARDVWAEWLIRNANNALIITDNETLARLRFKQEYSSSLLLTNEVTTRYPYLEPLADSAPTEQWVLKIAQLMRFHVLITHTPMENFPNNPYTGTIQLIEKTANPESVLPQIYLIQQYFIPEKTKRIREIRNTLKQNIDCKSIDKIILLNEQIYSEIPQTDKIEQVVIGTRLTYYDVFKYAKDNLPKNSFVIFSNSDIYLDETINNIYNLDMDKKFLSLLRYDTFSNGDPPKLFGPRADSQDTWVFKTESIDFEPTLEDFGFNFGVPGCDNVINIVMFKKRFVVSNPALTIKTYHNQESQIRTYNRGDVIDKPMFLYVSPTAIQDYSPLNNFNDAKDKSWTKTPNTPFPCKIKYVHKDDSKALLANLSMKPEYNYSLDSDNLYNSQTGPDEDDLYILNDPKFVVPSGIISDFKNLYLGKNDIWKDEWTNAKTSVLTATVSVPSICAVHYPNTLTPQTWFSYYLSECLGIYNHTKSNPVCFIHPDPEVEILARMLDLMQKKSMTFIRHNPDIQCYSNKVYLLSPKKSSKPTLENISRLRELVPHIPTTQPHVVLISDSKHEVVNDDLVTKLVELFNKWDITILTNNSPYEKRFKSLMKADLVIAPSKSEWGALDWMWLMKSGSTVVELMEQLQPRGDHIHLAGASNINYVLLPIKPEPVLTQTQNLINSVTLVLKEQITVKAVKAVKTVEKPQEKPIITFPTGSALIGLHHHTGDTFREMVDIWKERNYCIVEPSETASYVWWGKVGDTLLYDRPTMRWLNTTSYKLALFGNSMPENPAPNQLPWSFWPRSPKQVELFAKRTPLKYSERTYSSIFIGKIENGVQMANRTKADWKSVIEKFYMPVDSTGGPYKYSQEEYLTMLCQSRFGLCLPGYGPKCNREIEYFATGTVPIITPGVDMVNYSVPPVKGIHYFSVEKPEEIPEIINKTTPEKWEEMSQQCRLWWKTYASAEGMFNLTKSLAKVD